MSQYGVFKSSYMWKWNLIKVCVKIPLLQHFNDVSNLTSIKFLPIYLSLFDTTKILEMRVWWRWRMHHGIAWSRVATYCPDYTQQRFVLRILRIIRLRSSSCDTRFATRERVDRLLSCKLSCKERYTLESRDFTAQCAGMNHSRDNLCQFVFWWCSFCQTNWQVFLSVKCKIFPTCITPLISSYSDI